MSGPGQLRQTRPPEGSQTALAVESDEGVIHELLGFRLGKETYAVPLGSVHEILKLPPVTAVPRAPAHVLGIISVRGSVTTVIDLRRRLQMDVTEPTRASRVLLVRSSDEICGVLVDEVLQVYRLRHDQVEVASSIGGDTAEYVVGIGRPGKDDSGSGSDDDLLILLDANLLSEG